MKTKNIIILIVLSFLSCESSKEDKFLENFKYNDCNKILLFNQLKEQINEKDLQSLNKSEAINEFVFNTNKKYYYGYKTKLSEKLYLISYGIKYLPRNNPNFYLTNWYDTYLCIYQKGIGVVSKIKMSSDEPILSRCKEDKGIYTIKSYMYVYKVEDTNENKSYFIKDSITTKYKIENNQFVKAE